jgi:hypothetical protein
MITLSGFMVTLIRMVGDFNRAFAVIHKKAQNFFTPMKHLINEQ